MEREAAGGRPPPGSGRQRWCRAAPGRSRRRGKMGAETWRRWGSDLRGNRDQIRKATTPTGGRTCVVVKAKEYNGYAKRDVWEKLEAWERS